MYIFLEAEGGHLSPSIQLHGSHSASMTTKCRGAIRWAQGKLLLICVLTPPPQSHSLPQSHF